MNKQQSTSNTMTRRAGAIALAALASLTVAVGCGGGEDTADGGSVDIEAAMSEGGVDDVGKSSTAEIKKYSDAKLEPVEAYTGNDESGNGFSIYVEAYETPEEAEAALEEEEYLGGVRLIANENIYVYVADESPKAEEFANNVVGALEG